MGILLSWLVLSVAVWITSALLPKMHVSGPGGVLLVAAIFGLLNTFVGWLLFVAIGIGTLGLGFVFAFVTRWVVDAILLEVTDSLTSRLSIEGWGTAFLAALLMAGIGTVAEAALRLGHLP